MEQLRILWVSELKNQTFFMDRFACQYLPQSPTKKVASKT